MHADITLCVLAKCTNACLADRCSVLVLHEEAVGVQLDFDGWGGGSARATYCKCALGRPGSMAFDGARTQGRVT